MNSSFPSNRASVTKGDHSHVSRLLIKSSTGTLNTRYVDSPKLLVTWCRACRYIRLLLLKRRAFSFHRNWWPLSNPVSLIENGFRTAFICIACLIWSHPCSALFFADVCSSLIAVLIIDANIRVKQRFYGQLRFAICAHGHSSAAKPILSAVWVRMSQIRCSFDRTVPTATSCVMIRLTQNRNVISSRDINCVRNLLIKNKWILAKPGIVYLRYL